MYYRRVALVNVQVVAITMSWVFAGAGAWAAPPVHVAAKARDRQYVLGEPVLLMVEVKNKGREALEVYEPIIDQHSICPEILTYIAFGHSEDTPFQQFIPHPCSNADAERAIFTLKPGERRRYELRLVYSYLEPQQLAFPKVGEYQVVVKYPLWLARPARDPIGENQISWRLESNVTYVGITKPQGIDAEVWSKINSPAVLYFLQWGRTIQDHEDVPMKAAALLKTVPDSSYHSALRWALKTYYHGYTVGENKLTEHEAELLRSVLEIELPEAQPFPEDERLNQVITYHLPERTTLDQVFKMISEQTGINFEVHRDLHIRAMGPGPRVTHPLRELMRHVSAYKAEWVRQGDGFLLRAAEEPKGTQD